MFMLAVITVGSAVPSFAQVDPQKEKEALYAKYNENYDSPDIEKRKIAIQAGKEYIQKFGENADSGDDPLVPYFKENVPILEKAIKDEEAEAIRKKKEAEGKAEQQVRIKLFSDSITAKNWAQTFTAGKALLTNNPKYLDVYIILATAGFDRAVAKDDTYNNEAIEYAKKAIQLINSGEKSETKNYGASFGKDANFVSYEYKTKEYQDGKENALGWLNFNIGYIMTYNQKKQKEALPYLFEATKHLSQPQKSPAVYRMIGEYYFDETARIENERQALLKTLNNVDNDKTLELLALEKGYAERGADAYARAYNLETDAAKRDGLYKAFLPLYKFRNNNKEDGAQAFLAAVKSKPLVDPTTAVQPIIEVEEPGKETPVTDETKPATDKMDKPATDKKPATTKPAVAPTKPATTKPATTPTKPSATVKKTARKTKKS